MIRCFFKYGSFYKILILTSFLASSGCKSDRKSYVDTISIRGSDTMMILAQGWAEAYMKTNNGISVRITGGGSGTGIASLLNGTADIANISRELNEREKSLAKKMDISLFQTKVAIDGIAIIVHPKNKIDSLTIENVRDIYIGKIKNWKELGGLDIPITLYGRENSSGTYEFFKKNVLGEDENGEQVNFSPSTQSLQGTAALGEAIARDEGGLGYGGIGYFALRKDIKVIALKKDIDSPGISPIKNYRVNDEAITGGEYPLSRFLYCYSTGKGKGRLQEYIDFVLSEKGQQIVSEMNYVPIGSLSGNR